MPTTTTIEIGGKKVSVDYTWVSGRIAPDDPPGGYLESVDAITIDGIIGLYDFCDATWSAEAWESLCQQITEKHLMGDFHD